MAREDGSTIIKERGRPERMVQPLIRKEDDQRGLFNHSQGKRMTREDGSTIIKERG